MLSRKENLEGAGRGIPQVSLRYPPGVLQVSLRYPSGVPQASLTCPRYPSVIAQVSLSTPQGPGWKQKASSKGLSWRCAVQGS